MQRKKVLVVEFDARDAQLLAAALRRNGYTALVTGSGAEAIDLFRNEDPDLAVLNLLMPDMPSVEIMRRFEGGVRHLPVIAINQLAGSRSQIYQKIGADEQIGKPIDQTAFLRAVERLIGPGSSETAAPPKRSAPTVADKAEVLPAKGSFKTLPFHLVLAQIFRKRAQGALEVRDEYGKALVSFHDGLPVALDAVGLARRLVRDGILTEEEARRIRRQAADAQATEEETLAKANLLLASELEQASREFALDVLTDYCRPTEARFAWTAGPVAAKGAPFDPAEIIARATRRFFAPEKMQASLEGKGRKDRPMYLGDDPARLPNLANQPETQAVIAAARAHKKLADVLSAPATREKLERAGYVLAVLKIIVFDREEAWTPTREPAAAPTPAAPPATAPVFNADDEPPPIQRAAAPPKPPEPPRAAVVTEDNEEPQATAAPEPEPAPPPPDEPLTDDQLLHMAEDLLRTKTYSKAQRCAGEWLERRGDDHGMLLLFARAAYHNRFVDPLQRLFDSVDALRRALALDPRFTEARCELAAILAEAGEIDLAVAELETATTMDPVDSEAQRELRIMRRRLSRAE